MSARLPVYFLAAAFPSLCVLSSEWAGGQRARRAGRTALVTVPSELFCLCGHSPATFTQPCSSYPPSSSSSMSATLFQGLEKARYRVIAPQRVLAAVGMRQLEVESQPCTLSQVSPWAGRFPLLNLSVPIGQVKGTVFSSQGGCEGP